MNLQVLANNIRRYRVAKKLSQPALAEASGLSLPSIKNLEGAKNEPRVKTVSAIAKALGIQLQELFVPVRELSTVRFRSSKRMQNRENIIADAARWLDDFNYLEGVVDDKIPFKIKQVAGSHSRESIIKVAHNIRKSLGLKPKEPIHDICGFLEHAGIKVLNVSVASDGFFGLSIGPDDGGPAVVVNIWDRVPVERRIYSAAHEFGHLILHRDAFDISKTEENKEEEKEADLFASHFLMPDEGFLSEWEEASGLHRIDRVMKVKRIFHVSYKTVLHRLVELGKADSKIWMRFNVDYKRRFGRTLLYKEEPMGIDAAEPFGLQRFDFFEDRLSRLTRKAIEGDKISMSRGAEILRIGIEEMQEIVNQWETA